MSGCVIDTSVLVRLANPHDQLKPCGEKTYMSDEWVCDRYKCVAVFSHHS
jgi:hypothetical protein